MSKSNRRLFERRARARLGQVWEAFPVEASVTGAKQVEEHELDKEKVDAAEQQ